MTPLWYKLTDQQPQYPQVRTVLAFFIAYIYELQKVIFDFKTSKRGVLDILKEPAKDPKIQQLFEIFGLSEQPIYLDESKTWKSMTLLDQIFQCLNDYIVIFQENPEIFDFEQTQMKEFNAWRQEILQNLCLILNQVNVSLNIVGRKA